MISVRMYNWIRTCMLFCASNIASLLKLSFVLGSTGIMFSASNFCMPLIGLYNGVFGTSLIWSLLFVVRIIFTQITASSLAFYIPGYCAALYVSSKNMVIRCGIPLVCLLLFLVHPIGYHAALYTVYWIIPIVVGLGLCKSLFAHALGATFTAHAVGSVIWLYTVPMTVSMWLSLIPLVALERLTFAAGIVVMYYGINIVSISVIKIKSYVHSVYSLIR